MKKIMVCLLCFVIADGAMAALPFGVNLLMNPSFEDFSDSVEPWKNDGCLSLTVSTLDAVHGSRSMNMYYDSDFDAAYQAFPLDAEDLYQTFRVSFSVKSLENKPVIVRGGIWEFSPNGITFHDGPWVLATTDWQTISYETALVRDDANAVRAVVQCAPQDTPKTRGHLLVDKVVFIKPVPEPTLVAPAPDGVKNVALNTTLEWIPADVSSWPSIIDPNSSAVRTAQYLYLKASTDDFSDVPAVVLSADAGSYSVGPLLEYTTYYWAVDTGIDGSGPRRFSDPSKGDPNTLLGPVWSFTTRGTVSIDVQPVGGYYAGTASDLTITASSLSPEPLSYYWYRSSDRIANGADVLAGTDRILPGTSVVKGYYYYCVVTNGYDSVTSDLVWVGDAKLMGHWKLDNNYQDDVSGPSGWTGTLLDADTGLAGLPSWTAGAENVTPTPLGAHEFVTDHDYIKISGSGAAGVFNFYPTGLTITAWVQRYNDGTHSAILGKQVPPDMPEAGDPWTGYALLITDQNRLQLRFADVSSESEGEILADGRWHFVAATYNVNTEEMSLYIDGYLDSTESNLSSVSSEAALSRMTTDLVLAAEDYRGLTSFHNGRLDDVRIYNYPLTLDEVQSLYYAFDYWHCENLTSAGADVNGDCKINLADLAQLAGVWLECGRVPAEKCDL